MLRRGRVGPTALSTLILFLIVATLVIAPVSALHVSAQSAAPAIETAQLRLWPEYDDPGLLVIFAGQFASGTKFPLQAAFPAPSGARNLQATYQNASSLINQPFEIKNGAVTYELPSAGFQLEYYLDRAPGGDQRTVNYSFVAPYAINTLKVEVQQPARSSGFTMTPASESSQKGSDGLTYYTFSRRNVAAGEKLDIKISYSKTDTSLSSPQLAVATTAAPAPVAPAAAAASTSTAVLPWVLIGLGALLLLGIAVYWLLSQRKPVAPAPLPTVRAAQVRPRPSGAGPRPTVAARPAPGAASFCTNCGNALKAEDRFCSQCGSPRRS